MYPSPDPKFGVIKIAAENTNEELVKRYYDLMEELKLAVSIFEFERASDLKEEIDIITGELSKRTGKRKIG